MPSKYENQKSQAASMNNVVELALPYNLSIQNE